MGLHTECSDGALMVCNKKKGNCQHEDQHYLSSRHRKSTTMFTTSFVIFVRR